MFDDLYDNFRPRNKDFKASDLESGKILCKLH